MACLGADGAAFAGAAAAAAGAEALNSSTSALMILLFGPVPEI
jgi:hypothetical protein